MGRGRTGVGARKWSHLNLTLREIDFDEEISKATTKTGMRKAVARKEAVSGGGDDDGGVMEHTRSHARTAARKGVPHTLVHVRCFLFYTDRSIRTCPVAVQCFVFRGCGRGFLFTSTHTYV